MKHRLISKVFTVPEQHQNESDPWTFSHKNPHATPASQQASKRTQFLIAQPYSSSVPAAPPETLFLAFIAARLLMDNRAPPDVDRRSPAGEGGWAGAEAGAEEEEEESDDTRGLCVSLSASVASEEEKGTEVGGAEMADPLLGATDNLKRRRERKERREEKRGKGVSKWELPRMTAGCEREGEGEGEGEKEKRRKHKPLWRAHGCNHVHHSHALPAPRFVSRQKHVLVSPLNHQRRALH